MNLKHSLIAALIVFAGGVYVGKNLNKPAAQLPAVAAKASAAAKYSKVTAPNGEVKESLECVGVGEAKAAAQAPIIVLKRYAVDAIGLNKLDAVAGAARLGDLPVFGGVVASKDEIKLLLRLEF